MLETTIRPRLRGVKPPAENFLIVLCLAFVVDLRSRLTRLAYERPELRGDLVPLLRDARTTPQTDRFKAALDDMESDLGKVLPWMQRRRLKGQGDQVAQNISRKAKVVLAFLNLSFQDPKKQKAIKKRLRRWTNFKKMIETFAKLKDGEAMIALAESMDTKSRDAWDKYRDLRDWVFGFVRAFDVAVETTMDVGPWTVRLMSHPHVDWDREAAGKLRYIIRRAVSVLERRGLGKAIGGKMQAWASDNVPVSGRGSHNTLASYNPSHDLTRVAVGSEAHSIIDTLVHELGHRFYFKAMGSRGRDAWRQFFGENVGKPDLDRVMRMWEDFARATPNGKWAGYFGRELKQTDPEQFMWLTMAVQAVGLDEEFNPYTGEPSRKKKNRPGLEVVREALPKLELFLHPVTAYSGVSAEELFAETFSHIVLQGPRRIPPIVRQAFRAAVPNARLGSVHVTK
jgi:hypothetical protein